MVHAHISIIPFSAASPASHTASTVATWTPVLVATIAAVAALIGYVVNGFINRRTELIRHYADALAEFEKYRQLPYTYHRRHDSTAETRAELATMMGDNQAALAFYRRSLRLGSPAVGIAYGGLIDKARQHNSTYRRIALSAPPVTKDADIEVGTPYFFDVREELALCVGAMRRELRFWKSPREQRAVEVTCRDTPRSVRGYEALPKDENGAPRASLEVRAVNHARHPVTIREVHVETLEGPLDASPILGVGDGLPMRIGEGKSVTLFFDKAQLDAAASHVTGVLVKDAGGNTYYGHSRVPIGRDVTDA